MGSVGVRSDSKTDSEYRFQYIGPLEEPKTQSWAPAEPKKLKRNPELKTEPRIALIFIVSIVSRYLSEPIFYVLGSGTQRNPIYLIQGSEGTQNDIKHKYHLNISFLKKTQGKQLVADRQLFYSAKLSNRILTGSTPVAILVFILLTQQQIPIPIFQNSWVSGTHFLKSGIGTQNQISSIPRYLNRNPELRNWVPRNPELKNWVPIAKNDNPKNPKPHTCANKLLKFWNHKIIKYINEIGRSYNIIILELMPISLYILSLKIKMQKITDIWQNLVRRFPTT